MTLHEGLAYGLPFLFLGTGIAIELIHHMHRKADHANN